MAFLFNRPKQKTNAELCRSTKEVIQKISSVSLLPDERLPQRLDEELSRNLAQMKITLQGTQEIDTTPQQVHQLVEYLIAEDILYLFACNIHKLPFEARKDVQIIFSNALRWRALPSQQGKAQDPRVVQWILNERPEVLITLCNGYNHRESAMVCGTILKEAIKNDTIAALILYDDGPVADGSRSKGLRGINPNVPTSGNGIFWQFFSWIDKGQFEISTDAFGTLRDILTKHKKLVAHWLLTNMERFVPTYSNTLIKSSNYVTQRQSLKLLSEILLDKSNYKFMVTFAESAENLRLAMTLLKKEQRMVAYEAFHIFKIFVANPNKTPGVLKVLIMNKQKLLDFLPGFLSERKDDDNFMDEKSYCIRHIADLPDLQTAGLLSNNPAQQAATASPAGPATNGVRV